MELQIKASLIALLDGIKAADGKIIVEETRKLDEIAAAHRATLHPQLLHFLGNRSYAKAIKWLEDDPNIPAGKCGRVEKREAAP